MRSSVWFALSLSAVMLAGAGGCAPGEEGNAPASAVSPEDADLWRWSGKDYWPGGEVPVCFDATIEASLRTTIRAQVEGSWDRAASINFWGFGDCPSSLPTGWLVVVRRNNIGGALGMTTRTTASPGSSITYVEFPQTGTPSNKSIVHEFGHVLGFYEENVSPSNCTTQTSGTSLEGEPDVSLSVMTQTACNSAATLSPWDVMGARTAYGMKAPGSIAGLGGFVLNIQGGSTDFGAAIVNWPSTSNAWNGRFVRSSAGSLQLTASNGSVSRCLNISGGQVSSNWTPLISWECNESYANNLFHFTGVAWRAMGTRCVQASSAAAGATLSIQACSTSSLQKWDFFEGNTRIRLSGTNLCATVPNGSVSLGNRITLQSCGSSYQSFGFTNGNINYGSMCMNVLGGTTANGNGIGLWDGCGYTPRYPNEQFTIRGPITAMGQCVDMNNSSALEGVGIGVYTCNGTGAQIWEYFW